MEREEGGIRIGTKGWGARARAGHREAEKGEKGRGAVQGM